MMLVALCGVTSKDIEIRECQNSGSVNGTEGVGGICGVGAPGASIYDSTNNGAILGENFVGGIVGAFEGTITGTVQNNIISNCLNTGNIKGKEDISGIAGYVENLEIFTMIDCNNTGVVEIIN